MVVDDVPIVAIFEIIAVFVHPWSLSAVETRLDGLQVRTSSPRASTQLHSFLISQHTLEVVAKISCS